MSAQRSEEDVFGDAEFMGKRRHLRACGLDVVVLDPPVAVFADPDPLREHPLTQTPFSTPNAQRVFHAPDITADNFGCQAETSAVIRLLQRQPLPSPEMDGLKSPIYGRRAKAFRLEAGLSQADLAKLAGWKAASGVSELESGGVRPMPPRLETHARALSKALGRTITPDELCPPEERYRGDERLTRRKRAAQAANTHADSSAKDSPGGVIVRMLDEAFADDFFTLPLDRQRFYRRKIEDEAAEIRASLKGGKERA